MIAKINALNSNLGSWFEINGNRVKIIQAKEIKKKYLSDKTLVLKDLGKEYNVDYSEISKLLRNKGKYDREEFGPPVKVRKDKMTECPFCGVTVDSRNYSKWHGNNCKKAPGYIAPKRKGKAKYIETTTGEVKYLFEFGEQYNVSTNRIIQNSRYEKPGRSGPLKGLNFKKFIR